MERIDGLEQRFLPVMPDEDDWRADAACGNVSDPEIFFPKVKAEYSEIPIKVRALCDACLVKAQCGEFAIVTKQKYGIWAGMSQDELRYVTGQRTRPTNTRTRR